MAMSDVLIKTLQIPQSERFQRKWFVTKPGNRSRVLLLGTCNISQKSLREVKNTFVEA